MRQRLLMTALIGIVALGCLAYINAATTATPRPADYRAAVMRVLDTQQIDYRDVEVADGCAPSYQLCRFYAGKVRIMAASTMSGQIDCRERWTTCTLTIPRARINGALLEDVRDPLFAHWEEIYGQFLVWL